MNVKDENNWRPWFAWHPVNVDGKFVWLKRIWCCRQKHPYLVGRYEIKYRVELSTA